MVISKDISKGKGVISFTFAMNINGVLMLNKKWIIVWLILSTCILMLLTSCRPSPTLEQVLYKTDSEVVDYQNENKLVDNLGHNQEKDNYIPPKDVDQQSPVERDRVKHNPLSGDEKDELSAPGISYDAGAEANFQSQDKPENFSSSDIDNAEDTGTEQSGEGKAQAADGGLGSGGTGLDGENQYATATAGERHLVNAFGEVVKLPKEVDLVAATGEAAVIVRMLGGGGRLVAANADFLDNQLVQDVFDYEGIKQVANLWPGNGASPLSETDFGTLLTLEPQACIELSGQTVFSEEQIARLKEQKIVYVVLPALSNSKNICSTVQLIGELLGDKSASGGTDAPKLASDYVSYYNATISEIGSKVKRFTYNLIDFDNDKKANGVSYLANTSLANVRGFYSLYISDCDEGAAYKLHNSAAVTLSENGLAVVRSGYSQNPMSYYMSIAGVVNASAIYPDYGQVRSWYVNPLASVSKTLTVTGGYAAQTKYALTVADPAHLGDEDFPAVIVQNSRIRDHIISDPLWATYDEITSTSGLTVNHGFLDGDGNIVPTTITGSYDIFINPSGIGSWTEGSAESILEPIWIAAQFYDAYSDDELRAKTKEFYRKFYRHELSDAQLDEILNN